MEDQQNGHADRADEDSRKLFVGGLPPSATKNEVETYFSTFGEVEMCTIKTDQYSGRSRGFGFLIYKDVSSVNEVLNRGEHMIGGKTIDPKRATPQAGDQGEKSTKIFVGGLDKSTTKEMITDAFSPRGNVVDVYLPTDKTTGEPKGFAFVNFDNSSIAESLISEGKMTINDKECDIKKANNKSDSQRGRGGFRGGRGFGRGRGGYGGGSYGGYDGGYGGGYDQYGGGYGYQGGYGGGSYGGAGYDQYGAGYDGNAGYGGGYGGYGYDQQQYAGEGGYSGGQDQYKMKGARGRGASSQYTPY